MLAVTPFAAALLLAIPAIVSAGPQVDTFSSGADYPFVVHGGSTTKTKQGLIFLHGSGSCGSDLSSNPFWDGAGMMLTQSGEAASIVSDDLTVILPLHPDCSGATREWTPSKVETVVALAKSKFKIADEGFICSGYSMGGKGTWMLAMAEPSLCKKLIVSAGYTQFSSSLGTLTSSLLAPLKNIPMQLFAGTSDDKQPASSTAGPVVNVLKSLGAPSVDYSTLNTDHSGMSSQPWKELSLWKWAVEDVSSSSSDDSSNKPAVAANAVQSTTTTSASSKSTGSSKKQSSCKASSKRRSKRRALAAAFSSDKLAKKSHIAPRHPGAPKPVSYGGGHPQIN